MGLLNEDVSQTAEQHFSFYLTSQIICLWFRNPLMMSYTVLLGLLIVKCWRLNHYLCISGGFVFFEDGVQ